MQKRTRFKMLAAVILSGMVLYTGISFINANISHNAVPKSYYSSNQTNRSMGEVMQVKAETMPEVLLVNKEHELPKDYVPKDLVAPKVRFNANKGEEKTFLSETAAHALEQLFAGADADGIKLYGVSGYRSYQTQYGLYYRQIYRNGQTYADLYSARPGKSEHQTGMAIDLSCASLGGTLVTRFASTPEGIWLAEHCTEYGFIIRYPEGKTEITGYAYEPWHIRYVGKSVAKYLKEKDITLDQYKKAVSYTDWQEDSSEKRICDNKDCE